METLELSLPAGEACRYPIVIGSGLLNEADLLRQHIPQKQVCIVSNETVAPLYLETVRAALAEKEVIEVILPDGEQYKTLAQYSQILDSLMQARFARDAVIVALGGGVVGDIAGFAAASYQRGMDFVQIPTTLLAQVDSSVGGKTGVNHTLGKNMIGAFHQPKAVIIDTDTLNTLPDREFSAGMAEVIKYGLINDLAFFEWIERNLSVLMRKNATLLAQAIAHCCRNKADIVAADERESGVRALLNLGHTFGHALETLTQYRQWKHGEAVAIGMRVAAELSQRRGSISEGDTARIIALLEQAGLPVAIGGEPATEAIYEAMFLDKKVRNSKLRLVLLTEMGQCEIVQGILESKIKDALDASQ